MAGRLDGKVAFITGAARGMGRSHAVRLAAEGADIIAVDIASEIDTVAYAKATPDDLAETVKEVEATGRRIVPGHADVRDIEAMRSAVEKGVQQLGRLDIVVANAGIFEFGATDEISELSWRAVIDINLTGVWHTCTVALPHLRGAGGGSIVIINSTAGIKGPANFSAYAASKHGAVGLMRALANELAPDLIRVNSVHPGTVDTPMLQNQAIREQLLSPDHRGEITREQAAAAFQAANALPIPWVEPADVSNAVAFLASDEARYVTGVILPVDAGATVK
jgi:(+)-trans-carveol dehydrogenase